MSYKLYYLKLVNKEKNLQYDRELEEGELDLISECNEILGSFNSFCDYYYIFKSNLKDLEDYLKLVEPLENRISSAIIMKNVINEINKLVINFAVAFRNYLDHYEITIKEIAGEESKEYKEFKSKCSKYFDKYFEYRFLYNLRHYNVHYKLPVSKIEGNIHKKKRIFLIEKDKLREWDGWKSIIKDDIDNLKEDINISDFVKKCKDMISKFNKDISYYNEPEVLGALNILKRYERKFETPYLVEEIKENDEKKFRIKEMYSEYINSINNIFNLGIISCSSYTKDFGLQIFDPFDLMFSKDEKEKFGLN